MKQAQTLVVPSKYESLSLVLLESFNYKVPVLANKDCIVLKDHIEESQGGITFSSYDEFSKGLNLLLYNQELRTEMGSNGFKYVQINYIWDKVIEKFDIAISDIKSEASKEVNNTSLY